MALPLCPQDALEERDLAVVVRAAARGRRRREEAEEAGPENETSSLAKSFLTNGLVDP